MPDDLPRIHKKRRPRNKPRSDAWLQQQLSAYRPIYTFRCALPLVLIYAFICVGISIALFKDALKAFEYVIDYTECHRHDTYMVTHLYQNGTLLCKYELELPEVTGQIYFYYGLHNFYQNIRKYEQSRNDRQLSGHLTETEDCFPLTSANKSDGTSRPIVPCGAVANSMFNDTFNLTYHYPGKTSVTPVLMTSDDLLHPSLRQYKYRNPKRCSDEDAKCPGFEGTVKPPAWPKPIEELGDKDTGRALENFDFIQWMETAALPNFRKLYRKLDQLSGSVFANGLPAGNYTLFVVYNFNVSEWDGRKLFIVQSDGLLGPKAMFQMYAFFGLGLFLFVLGCFMALVEFGPPLMETFRNMWEQCRPPDVSGL